MPQTDLADLTADDLQLLLSGTGGVITLESCREVAEFRDMRGPEVKASDPERLGKFATLFWKALALLEPRQLLKLIEFATAHRTIVKTLIVNLVRHCSAFAFLNACHHASRVGYFMADRLYSFVADGGKEF